MFFAILFLIELFILFLFSRLVTRKLSSFFYKITRSQKLTIYFMAFLFFPGTVIHELSHLIMAGLLFVPVGRLELWPKLEDNHVKLGSLSIANTDVFRRFLIGAAPFLLGSSLLIGMLFYAAQYNLFSNYLYIFFFGYAAFEIGNTMFSSQIDMEGAVELFGTLLFIGLVLYLLGINIPTAKFSLFFEYPIITQIGKQGSLYLLIPLGLDAILLLFLKVFLRS